MKLLEDLEKALNLFDELETEPISTYTLPEDLCLEDDELIYSILVSYKSFLTKLSAIDIGMIESIFEITHYVIGEEYRNELKHLLDVIKEKE